MSLDDVAEYLRTGRGRARTWLIERGVRPALELGKGKGGGPRYRVEDVTRAVDGEAEDVQRNWTAPTIFDGSLSQALHKLGRGGRGRQGGTCGH